MIIVSQNKKEAVPFNSKIFIDDKVLFLKDGKFQEDGGTWLGSYKTEERAKEVLREIIERYGAIEDFKTGNPRYWQDNMNIYEMPGG